MNAHPFCGYQPLVLYIPSAGLDGDRVVNAIMKAKKPFGFGWNAKTNKFGDMISQGVIDPAKVCISAIEHSTSVAGLVLTTEGMMIEEEQESTKSPQEEGEL